MPSIPGLTGTVTPNVYVRVRTLTRATSTPGGLRTLAILGEGMREEVLVDSALGDGRDGFNPTFTANSDGYGRYFRTANTSLIPNRSELFLNGSPLRLLEGAVNSSEFSSFYDARLDPETGKLELQRASLLDQGGEFYLAGSNNTGDGYLDDLVLVDKNAPQETWTIRATSVLRDSYGAPMTGQATFTASGSVSGQLVDEYGQPFVWRSDGAPVSNGVLSFSVHNLPSATAFEIGDRFTVKIASRVLQARDRLEMRYIAEIDLNTPETFINPQKLFEKHGQASEANTLSLGAQMAFENGATSVMALQAKPPLPRRVSEIVLPPVDDVTDEGGASGNDDPDDLIFYISTPGKPDFDSVVKFFVIGTDGTESQIFPNKVSFYDPDITDAFSTYETSGTSTALLDEFMDPSSSGMPFSYTVVSDDNIEQGSTDGTISPIGMGTTAYFDSASAQFSAEDLTDAKQLDFHNTSTANLGRYDITEVVSATRVKLSRGSGSFISENNLRWQLIKEGSDSQRILFTNDLALSAGQGLRISYIDQRDADFFDAGWADALQALETQDVQIVVLLPTQTFSAIQQAGRVHVETMSSVFYKRERVLFTGCQKGLTYDQVIGNALAAPEDIGLMEGIQGDDPEEILDANIEDLADYSVANNFGDTFRVVWFFPDEIIRVIRGTRTSLPGYFMAAAAGGLLAGEPNIAQPLTNKELVGFSILNNKLFTDSQLNVLVAHGICVVQPIIGGGRIIWGKTTTQSGFPEEEEVSIVFIRDYVAKTLRLSFRTFIGQPESFTIIPSLTSKAVGVLNSLVGLGFITAHRNLHVSRNDIDPRQFDISCEVQPNFPVSFIWIDCSIGLF